MKFQRNDSRRVFMFLKGPCMLLKPSLFSNLKFKINFICSEMLFRKIKSFLPLARSQMPLGSSPMYFSTASTTSAASTSIPNYPKSSYLYPPDRFKKRIVPSFAKDMPTLQYVFYRKKDKIKFKHADIILQRLTKLPTETLLANSAFIEDLMLHLCRQRVPVTTPKELTTLMQNASIVACKNPDVWKKLIFLLKYMDFSYFPHKLSIVMNCLTTASGVPMTETLARDLDQRFQQSISLNKDFLDLRIIPNIVQFYEAAGLELPTTAFDVLIGRLARQLPFLSIQDKAKYLEILAHGSVRTSGYVYPIFDKWTQRDLTKKEAKEEEVLETIVSFSHSISLGSRNKLFENVGEPNALDGTAETLRGLIQEKKEPLLSFVKENRSEKVAVQLLLGSIQLFSLRNSQQTPNPVISKGLQIITENEKWAQNEPQLCLELYQSLVAASEEPALAEKLLGIVARSLMVAPEKLKQSLGTQQVLDSKQFFNDLAKSI